MCDSDWLKSMFVKSGSNPLSGFRTGVLMTDIAGVFTCRFYVVLSHQWHIQWLIDQQTQQTHQTVWQSTKLNCFVLFFIFLASLDILHQCQCYCTIMFEQKRSPQWSLKGSLARSELFCLLIRSLVTSLASSFSVTFGKYLRPSKRCHVVSRFVIMWWIFLEDGQRIAGILAIFS